MLDWRQLSKLKSTYADALVETINPDTGRVHTYFALAVAITGPAHLERPQSAEHPDPHRGRPQDPPRLCCARGPELLSVDYSQIELRLAADMAEIEPLKEAFQAGSTFMR